jgi:anaerobic magnesium-protoporphyrin IX monomethyl ester cyclase
MRMTEMIDCFLVGHNEMNFVRYEKIVKAMGVKSGAYRDLNYNFIQYKNNLYTAPEIYNFFSYGAGDSGRSWGDLNLGETFSATIAYLGTFLHRQGLTFDYVNSFQTEQDELAKQLQNGKIRTVAILTTLYVSAFPIMEIVALIRKYHPSVPIIVGGPFVATHARTQDEDTLQFLFKSIGADFYINSSQGEATLVKLIHRIRNGLETGAVENLYRRENDTYIATRMIREDNQLEDNRVDWSLFSGRVGKFVALRTAISCPFSCAFCGFPQHAGAYQTASIEAIEHELDGLKALGNVECINFIDDTFNVPPERFKAILRMMIKNRYNFKWHSYFRCQFADRETVELMRESGCEGVFLGFESGSEKLLRMMNKSVRPDQYYQGHALLNENDILTFGSFIIGFPGETRETVAETVRFIDDLQPTFYRAQLWYCEPITPVWRERDKYDIKGSGFEWSHSTMTAQEGCDWLDWLFLNVRNSVWLPQYNFDFVNLFHLRRRGMSLAEIKTMLTIFNEGIKAKILHPEVRETSEAIMMRLKAACNRNAGKLDGADAVDVIAKYNADFSF